MGEPGGQMANSSKALRMRDLCVVSIILLSAPLIAGCAQIKAFSVAPGTICPGETVEINWEASGRVVLKAAPPWWVWENGRLKGRIIQPNAKYPFYTRGAGFTQERSTRVVP